MKTIELERKKIYCGVLLLVNARYPLINSGVKSLIPVDVRYPDVLMSRDAANVLQLIMEKISAVNSIVPVSGYRSSQEQTAIYNDSIKNNGEDFTRKYVALPNHSEHQTGLAIDLGLNKEKIDFICPDFPYSGICDKFRRICSDYGFVLRYAEDKEEITGISHEPWHFRYVGFPHSKIMEKNGLSLEEYIEFIKFYRDDHRLIYEHENEVNLEIYYVPANDTRTFITVPETCVYQISGNNTDGFIVTIWKQNIKRKEKMHIVFTQGYKDNE